MASDAHPENREEIMSSDPLGTHDVRTSANVYAAINGLLAGFGVTALFFLLEQDERSDTALATLAVAIVAFGMAAVFYGHVHGSFGNKAANGNLHTYMDELRSLIAHDIAYLGITLLFSAIVLALINKAVAPQVLFITLFAYGFLFLATAAFEAGTLTVIYRGAGGLARNAGFTLFAIITIGLLMYITAATPAWRTIYFWAALSVVYVAAASAAFLISIVAPGSVPEPTEKTGSEDRWFWLEYFESVCAVALSGILYVILIVDTGCAADLKMCIGI